IGKEETAVVTGGLHDAVDADSAVIDQLLEPGVVRVRYAVPPQDRDAAGATADEVDVIIGSGGQLGGARDHKMAALHADNAGRGLRAESYPGGRRIGE